MGFRLGFGILWLVLAALPASARVELHLTDGQVITGEDIELEEGNYLIEDDEGQVVAIPVALVARLAFIGEAEPDFEEVVPDDEESEEAEEPSGPPDSDPDTEREGFIEGARQLAGNPAELPRRSDQLAALGDSAEFPRDVVDPSWTPGSGWLEEGSLDFAPARWPRSLVDSSWTPTSGFRTDSILDSRPTRWQQGVVDSTWIPVDGFRGGF